MSENENLFQLQTQTHFLLLVRLKEKYQNKVNILLGYRIQPGGSTYFHKYQVTILPDSTVIKPGLNTILLLQKQGLHCFKPHERKLKKKKSQSSPKYCTTKKQMLQLIKNYILYLNKTEREKTEKKVAHPGVKFAKGKSHCKKYK